MKRQLLIGLVLAVFLFRPDGAMLMGQQYEVQANLQRSGVIFAYFGPFSDRGMAEQCLMHVAGRENCIGAKIRAAKEAEPCDAESPYRIQWYADGQPSTPPPGIDPDAPMPAPLPPDAGDYFKKTAAAPGQRLFNQLYGSSGFGSSEPECPEGQCPSGQCPTPQAESREQVAKPPTSVVHVDGASGMIVATNGHDVAVLTAYHVVEGGPQTGIPLRKPGGTRFTADVCKKRDGSIAVDKAADIALLRFRSKKPAPPWYCLADEQPDVGDYVWTCGLGPSGVYRRIPGEVLDYNEEAYGKRPCEPDSIMVVSGEAQAGDSGGPIFGATGKLVGIVSRSTRDPEDGSRRPDFGVERTWSTSLNSIGALCADSLFPFPWRRDVERELEEAKQLPLPYPPDPERSKVSFVSTQIETDLAALSERLAKAEAQIAELTGKEPPKPFDDKSLSTSVAAAKTKADAAEKAAKEARATADAAEKTAKDADARAFVAAAESKKKAKEPFWRKWWRIGNTAGMLLFGVGSLLLFRKVAPLVKVFKAFLQADIREYMETGDELELQKALKKILPPWGDRMVDLIVRMCCGPKGTAARKPAKKKGAR